MPGKTHRVGKSLIDVSAQYGAEENCLAFLEKARWPDGVACLACESKRISKFTAKGRARTNKRGETAQSPDRHLYQCLECGHQFTVTVGTIFNDTHLPLTKWFLAVGMMCNAKKGISAKQMERDLGVSYRTAWYLCHRIRKAMQEGPAGMFTGTVEADETYVGGKYDKRRKRARWDKEPVFGIVERGGTVQSWHVPQVNRYHVIGKLRDNIAIDATLYTDESQMYKRVPKGIRHEIVNHSAKEWVRGDVHTGTIDGYWGLLKRAIIGTFHQVSIKHLHRYLTETQYKWNHRRDAEAFAAVIVGLLIQAGIQYKALTGEIRSASPPEA